MRRRPEPSRQTTIAIHRVRDCTALCRLDALAHRAESDPAIREPGTVVGVLSRIGEYLRPRIRRYDGRIQQHAPARVVDELDTERLQFLGVAELFALRMDMPPERRDNFDAIVLGSVVAID